MHKTSIFNAAVIITTIGRKNLLRAVRSVFAQKFSGSIQILIGFDIDLLGNKKNLMSTLESECPPNIKITWIDVGYSTSARHGGVHTSFYGGSLRTSMSFLANSDYIIYLDDDDWLLDQHVATMLSTIGTNAWAFSYSYYADGNTSTPLCVDEIESVGVNCGLYAESFGGFVRPSGLTLRKTSTMHILHLWSTAMTIDGDGEDRLVFDQLRKLPHAIIKIPTICASIDPLDGNHQIRKKFMQSRGISYSAKVKIDTSRNGAIEL